MLTTENLDDVAVRAQQILDYTTQVYSEFNVALPAKHFMVIGTEDSPNHSCEQVTVTYSMLQSGVIGQAPSPQNCHDPQNAVFVLEIVRCGPKINNTRLGTVTDEAQTENSKMIMRDSKLMAEIAERVGMDPAFLDGVQYTVVSVPNQGNFISTRASINVMV